MDDGTVLHHVSLGSKLGRAPRTSKRPLLVVDCPNMLKRWKKQTQQNTPSRQ